MEQGPIAKIDEAKLAAGQLILFMEYVKYDFGVTGQSAQTVIMLKPNQFIHSMFAENLKSFESWELLADKLHLTKVEVVTFYAEITMPQRKFELYQKLVASGRTPLYLVDSVFPYDYYNDLKAHHSMGYELYRYNCLSLDGSYIPPQMKGIEDYTESVLRAIRGIAVVNINKPVYDKPLSLWVNLVTVEEPHN